MFSFRPTEGRINSIRFSPFLDGTIASAQDDGAVSLHDVNQKAMSAQFTKHQASARGIAFSPLSKLLLCSVGLDKHAFFYDIK